MREKRELLSQEALNWENEPFINGQPFNRVRFDVGIVDRTDLTLMGQRSPISSAKALQSEPLMNRAMPAKVTQFG